MVIAARRLAKLALKQYRRLPHINWISSTPSPYLMNYGYRPEIDWKLCRVIAPGNTVSESTVNIVSVLCGLKTALSKSKSSITTNPFQRRK